jgi:hypothetical protein
LYRAPSIQRATETAMRKKFGGYLLVGLEGDTATIKVLIGCELTDFECLGSGGRIWIERSGGLARILANVSERTPSSCATASSG